jgi:predicted phosphodiesterase
MSDRREFSALHGSQPTLRDPLATPKHDTLGSITRVLIVGDVHGCVDELHALIALAELNPDDRIVLAGDLVAKGPDPAGVLQLARERRCLGVLGNHDARWIRHHRAPGSVAMSARAERDASRLSDRDWQDLESLAWTLSLPDHNVLVVHAGLVPGVPLYSQSLHDLIHMRSVLADGTIGYRAADGVPWASRWQGPQTVVFGHDALRGLQQHPHALGLDTGCVYGKQLTGLLLPERRLISVPAKRVYSEPRPD